MSEQQIRIVKSSIRESDVQKSNVVQQVVGIRSQPEKSNFRSLIEGALQEPYRGIIGPLQTICLTIPTPHICYYILQVNDTYGSVSHYAQSGLSSNEQGVSAKILIENQTDKQREFLISWI
jgi:hypothetical protein